jgi:hypothetical protein
LKRTASRVASLVHSAQEKLQNFGETTSAAWSEKSENRSAQQMTAGVWIVLLQGFKASFENFWNIKLENPCASSQQLKHNSILTWSLPPNIKHHLKPSSGWWILGGWHWSWTPEASEAAQPKFLCSRTPERGLGGLSYLPAEQQLKIYIMMMHGIS